MSAASSAFAGSGYGQHADPHSRRSPCTTVGQPRRSSRISKSSAVVVSMTSIRSGSAVGFDRGQRLAPGAVAEQRELRIAAGDAPDLVSPRLRKLDGARRRGRRSRAELLSLATEIDDAARIGHAGGP